MSEDELTGQQQMEALDMDDDAVIERILEHKKTDNGNWFKVSFIGYGSANTVWMTEREMKARDTHLLSNYVRTFNAKVRAAIENTKNENNEQENSDMYEVEKILGHRIVDGKREVQVRWSGYNADEDTWESEDSVRETANEIVDEYYNSLRSREVKPYVEPYVEPDEPVTTPVMTILGHKTANNVFLLKVLFHGERFPTWVPNEELEEIDRKTVKNYYYSMPRKSQLRLIRHLRREMAIYRARKNAQRNNAHDSWDSDGDSDTPSRSEITRKRKRISSNPSSSSHFEMQQQRKRTKH